MTPFSKERIEGLLSQIEELLEQLKQFQKSFK